jgi:hypothetical protein
MWERKALLNVERTLSRASSCSASSSPFSTRRPLPLSFVGVG